MVSAIIGRLEAQLEGIEREAVRLNGLSFDGGGYREEQGKIIAQEFGAVGLTYDRLSGNRGLSRVSVVFEGFPEPTQEAIAGVARQIEEKLGGTLGREVVGERDLTPYTHRLRAQVPTEVFRARLLGIPVGKPVQEYGSVSAAYGRGHEKWKAIVSVYSPEIDHPNVRAAADIVSVLFGYKSPQQIASEKSIMELIKASKG